MKKSIFIYIFLFITMAGISIILGITSNAEPNLSMDFVKANNILLENNTTLKKLEYSKEIAEIEYYLALENSLSLQDRLSSLKRANRLSFFDEVELIKQIELTPLKVNNSWKSIDANIENTKNNLTLSLRDLFIGLYSVINDTDLANERIKIAEQEFNQAQINFSKGLIDQSELLEYEYNLIKTEIDYDTAERNKENISRNINSLIYMPLNQIYEDLSIVEDIRLYEEKYQDEELVQANEFVAEAVQNRLEVKTIEQEIALKEKELELIQSIFLYLLFDEGKKDYEDVVRELESLELQLKQTRSNIEKEINVAIVDLKIEKQNIESLKREIDLEKRKLEQFSLLYTQGKIVRNDVDNLALNLKELENSLETTMYQYVTKRMKLNFASGIDQTN